MTRKAFLNCKHKPTEFSAVWAYTTQEDQLGALGLVVNTLILWNTRYMEAALNYLKSQGFEPKPEDLARLSPLRSRHFNVLGRYHFNVTDSVLKGEMRPLRSPAGRHEPDDFLDDDT